MENLPKELLLNVFAFCPLQDFGWIIQVCKLWKTVLEGNQQVGFDMVLSQ
jgi:hypothetical protein